MKYIGLLYWRFNQLSTGVLFIEIWLESKKNGQIENDKQEEADFLLHNTTSHTQNLYQIS